MPTTPRTSPARWAACVAAGAAAAVCAAPFVPARTQVPDELRCLAGIQTVSHGIDQLPALAANDATRTRLDAAFREALEGAGFTLSDQPTPPRLGLQFFIGTDAGHADMVALTTILAVHQEVELRRLNQPMTLPVASIVTTALGERDQLEDLMLREIRAATRLLRRYVQSASREP